MNEYNPHWPDDLREAERTRYRAECRLRNLTARMLEAVSLSEFDAIMDQIEVARDGLYHAGQKFYELSQQYNKGQEMK